MKSIKNRIMSAIVQNLKAMESSVSPTAPGRVRFVTREMDPLKASQAMPCLMIYEGDEVEVGQDERGRTYRFPVTVKILLSDQRGLAEAKDVLVPEVQGIMENNLQLGGLCDTVEGGAETPFLSELHKPEGGALVSYEVQYRRLYGNPYATY